MKKRIEKTASRTVFSLSGKVHLNGLWLFSGITLELEVAASVFQFSCTVKILKTEVHSRSINVPAYQIFYSAIHIIRWCSPSHGYYFHLHPVATQTYWNMYIRITA